MVRNEATVEVTGWFNNPRTFDWGTAFQLTVDVRSKNDTTGEWETTDKTVYDCTIGEQFTTEAKQVRVAGRITGVNTYTKKDGTTGVSIKVRAAFIDDALNSGEPLGAIDESDAPF